MMKSLTNMNTFYQERGTIKMKSILEALYGGWILPVEMNIPKDPEYWQTNQKMDELKEGLQKNWEKKIANCWTLFSIYATQRNQWRLRPPLNTVFDWALRSWWKYWPIGKSWYARKNIS
jgi:hypothetical protein